MKLIERSEVLGLGDYEPLRERFRARVIAEKKVRRVAVGPRASALFENRDTVLLQIQEMLRTERITREAAILHEIETYNELMPGTDELSCTLFLEVDDGAERAAFLKAAVGLERHVSVAVGAERAPARFDPARSHEETASAVNYLKFALSKDAVSGLLSAAKGAQNGKDAPEVALEIDHPAYRAKAVLGRETLVSLAEDLLG